MRVIIIGYGPGGVSAAMTVRAFEPAAEITILTEETMDAHRRPGSALALERPGAPDLFIGDWSVDSLMKRGIRVETGVSVVGGDPGSRTIEVSGGDMSVSMEYDRLIIAVGGTPSIPRLPGVDMNGVFTIQNASDASRVGTELCDVSSVAVVGAGFSGLEAAERLRRMGKEVHLIVRSRLLRRLLEPQMSGELQDRIGNRVLLHIGESPESITGDDHVRAISIGGREIAVGAVLMMTGVRPRTELARQLGLKIGPTGGIAVNEKMQTSVQDVYAVGDCAEVADFLTGRPVLLPVGSTAARAGRQAGVAAVGKDIIYEDVSVKFQYDHIFGTDIVCVGHSTTTAADVGVKTRVEFVENPAEFARIALVTDNTGRIVGGQVLASRMGSVIGYQIYERVRSRANLFAEPLLAPLHNRLRERLERVLGPIR